MGSKWFEAMCFGIGVLALGLLYPPWIAAQDGPAADGATDRFEAYLDGVVAAQFRDYALVGMTFALVRDGALVFSKGYGVADMDSGTPVLPGQTLFRPGSVSKLVTWTAVMQLVEQGLIDLDAPVADYIDQFELPNEFGQPLTMSHIMSHAVGLEDGGAGYLFAESADDLIGLATSLEVHMPSQVRAPGTYSAYSNWATSLAGLAVANVSGMSFEDYVAEKIFAPLGMTHATFEEPLPVSLAGDMAQGYITRSGGIDPLGFEFIKNFGPAGALSATAEDMARFIISHVSDGAYGDTRILQAVTARLMHSRLFVHDPRVMGMAHGFLEIERNGLRFIGHSGATIAFHSDLVLRPESDFGFFLSFNSSDGARARSAVTSAVIDYFYPASGEGGMSMEPLEGSAERIARVAGSYRGNRRSFTKLEGIFALAGDLVIAPGPEGTIVLPGIGSFGGRYIETEPHVFTKQGRQEQLVFETDESGRVSHMFLRSAPIVVADRLELWESAGTHQGVIVLALLAAFFVLLNSIRNRGRVRLNGPARWGKLGLDAASIGIIGFAAGIGLVSGTMDMVIFEFPPAGTGLVLILPILIATCTALGLVLLVPVWKSELCNVWQRLRYSYVALLYALLVCVFWYWNLLGWNY